MSNPYYFDKVARAERYFVASLFVHFLLSNNFAGQRRLFQRVFGQEACSKLADEFELVSELDPVRDGSIQNPNVKKLYREFRRIAVPDLFMRWGELCLIIEAKFFTDPSADELNEQVSLQQQALGKVKPFTAYKNAQIKFGVLVIVAPKNIRTDIVVLTWDEIIELMKETGSDHPDLEYCANVIQKARDRALHELKKTSLSYEKLRFDELLERLPLLIRQGKVFIGYTGGIDELSTATEKKLVERSHYKISDIQWSENWITIDQFLHRVFELRGFYKRPTEED